MRQSAEEYIQNYVFTLIEAHSSIQYQQSILSNINHRKQQAEDDAMRYQKKKSKLQSIHDKIKKEANDLNQNCSLEAHFKKKMPSYSIQKKQSIAESHRVWPKIEIVDMNWALQYLKQVNQNIFGSIQQLVIQHKKGMQGFETTLRKYEQKLQKKQQNLQKALSQIKNNNRRYL